MIGATRASADISFQAMLGTAAAARRYRDGRSGGGGRRVRSWAVPAARAAAAPIAASCSSASSRRPERGGLTTEQVIDRLRRNLGVVPGIRLFMFAAQDLRGGGRQSDSNYQYTLTSTDLDLLQKWAPLVAKRMETVEGDHRRVERSRSRRPAVEPVDRPQDGLEPRRSGAGHRQRAQQRLFAAADLDRLYPAQPVPGGAGDRSEIPDRSVRSRPHLRRRRQRHPGAAVGRRALPARSVGAGGAITRSRSRRPRCRSTLCPTCRWRSRPATSSARSTNCTCRRAFAAVSTAMPAISTRPAGGSRC